MLWPLIFIGLLTSGGMWLAWRRALAVPVPQGLAAPQGILWATNAARYVGSMTALVPLVLGLVGVLGMAGLAPAVAAPASMGLGLLVASVSLLTLLLTLRQVRPGFPARQRFEGVIRALLALSSVIAILTTLGIVLSLVVEAVRFWGLYPLGEFLSGLHWSPQTAIRTGQAGATGSFGIVPLLGGTLLIMVIALGVAGPVGLLSAVYMSEYASQRLRSIAKPMLELLAGIPTVVYGFFAVIVVAPLLRHAGAALGLSVSSESALGAGLVMGIMIIPFISSLTDDVIAAVPQRLRDGALGLGATRYEMVRHVVLPAALPGIVSAFLLAVSRAIGETMIVVMAAGMAANLTLNPLASVTTVTVQIVSLLVGDQEFDSPKTLAAFALGLTLLLVTLVLNVIALQVVKRYREKYD
jgi:phosphate transport system permease protein